MSLTLSREDIDAIAEAVVAKQRAALLAPAQAGPELITRPDAMRILGCSSKSAFHRAVHDLGVKSIRGRYRRRDITNAIARRAAA